MTLDTIPRNELRSKLADLLGVDRIARFRVRAIAKVRVMQTSSEHEQLSVGRRDIPGQLFEAMFHSFEY